MTEKPVIKPITALIVGGQGTYRDSLFFTEFPDRELSLEYMIEVRTMAERFKYTHIIPSGGFTQAETPNVSEAESFEKVCTEFGVNLDAFTVVKDEVALDSAENIICGLMALRIYENYNNPVHPRPIGRIGFYSQWRFKKRRMTELAKQLGIEKSFYFHGYADASMAAAGDAARIGEQMQLDAMIANDDFLLLGEKWEEKRRDRYKKGRTEKGKSGEGPEFVSNYEARMAVSDYDLKKVFRDVFDKLSVLKRTTIEELINNDHSTGVSADASTALDEVRKKKLEDLRKMFNTQVIQGVVNIS